MHPTPNVSLPVEEPLSDEESNILSTTLQWRRQIYGITYLSFFFISFFFSLGGSGLTLTVRDFVLPEHEVATTIKYNEPWVSKRTFWVGIILLESIVIGSGIYFYRKKIQPLRRDIDCGNKLKIPYTVMRKEYFPITNQYFLFIDNTTYMNHEVDATMYTQINPGDVVYISRAIHSGIAFRKDGRLSL